MYDPRDHFDLTPQQYHAGLDKLWNALGLTKVQDSDVFSLCASELDRLRAIVSALPDDVADRLFSSSCSMGDPKRLVMELRHKLDGPGWCKSAVADQVRDAITTASAAAAKEVDRD